MVRNPVAKDFFREIRKTPGRFISITLLIMLAVGFYSGLRATQPDMLITADDYIDSHNMYDIRVISTLGLTEDDVTAISLTDGVTSAEGSYSLDAEIRAPNSNIIISLETFGEINTPQLLEGRLPAAENECAAEKRFMERMGISIGDSFSVDRIEQAFDEDALSVREFTVVGTVRSPLYLTHFQRGSTTLGGGNITAYVFITPEAVKLDNFTEINVTVEGAMAERVYTDAYDDIVERVSERIEQLETERVAARRAEIVGDAELELEDGRREVEDGWRELKDGRAELDDARFKYEDGLNELLKARDELGKIWDGFAEIEDGERQVNDGRRKLREGQTELDSKKSAAEAEFAEALQTLEEGQYALDAGWEQYYAGLSELETGQAQWDALPDFMKEAMPETAAALESGRAKLEAAYAELTIQQTALDAGFAEFNAQRDYFESEIAAAQATIDTESARLNNAERELRSAREELERVRVEAVQAIADGEAELSDAWDKIVEGENELLEGEAELLDAEAEIRDAEEKIQEIPKGQWYVTGREMSPGYIGFRQDADRMGALGNIFPIIFFAVAVLVCLTTMTRMVDEQRVEIGTFKALGLSRTATAGKFIFYGLFAALIGIAGGLALGMSLLPTFIYTAYSLLYDMPPLLTPLHIGTVSIAAAAALFCTVGATLGACAAALHETPSNLLRPRAPVPGKRIFLEYITPLWSRMSFFAKVSARNVLRYKKRLIMTIVGVAGCTALLVTGFGLRDSIVDLPDVQFGGIFMYDLLAVLDDDADAAQLEALTAELGRNENIAGYTFVRAETVDFATGEYIQSGDLTTPVEQDGLNGFVTLGRFGDGEPLELTGGVIVTAKLAELLNVGPGDTMTLISGGRYTVTVADVAEHYVDHYVYMPPDYYCEIFGGTVAPNRILVKCTDSSDGTIDAASEALLEQDATGYLANFKSAADSFKRSIGSINSVIVIIVAAAAALAFIVLFNLSNINITERRRELATIKVLGFYDSEVTKYIFRENTFLTLFGIALGLIGGKILHGWLIRTVEVDFTMFLRTLNPRSYVIAALMTAAFAIIVNVIGHVAMKRINMVESLKTNE